jgi:hypothetical protein
MALVIACGVIDVPDRLLAQRLAFEVASVKPQEALFVMQGTSAPDVFERRATTLGILIAYAFKCYFGEGMSGKLTLSLSAPYDFFFYL